MKKIYFSFLFLSLSSCGDYVESKIDLNEDQETAISNFLTQECITKNADVFNNLATKTLDWENSDINEEYFYEIKNSTITDTKKLIILKKTAALMYIYVESTDPLVNNKVYKYTTTDNTNHMNNIKQYACNASNSFTGDVTKFTYISTTHNPDSTDPDRTTYAGNYTILGSEPIFFSLFNYKYTKTAYEEDAVTTTTTVDVSMKITNTIFNNTIKLTYEDEFNDALHCVFDTASPNWLEGNFPESLANTATCSANVFNWDNDIIAK